MKFRVVLLIVGALVLLTANSAFAGNPFLSKSKSEQTQQEGDAAVAPAPTSLLPGFLAPVLRVVNAWQKQLKRQLTAFARDMKQNPVGASFFLFLLLSFVYGMVHAIGPGHGKSVVMSYFLNRPGSLWRGLAMGHLITAVHVASGVAVVLVMALILDTTRIADFEAASPTLEAISYTLVILVGVYLVIHTGLDLRKKCWQQPSPPSSGDMRSMLVTAVVTGLVPCPGAALILLFSVILGVFVQGLVAMVFIALGMGLTTSAFALLAIGSRKAVLTIATRNEKAFMVLYAALSLGGALLIIGLGSVMLLGVA